PVDVVQTSTACGFTCVRQRLAEYVAQSDATQGRELAVATQVRGDAVVDLFGGHALQDRVVERTVRHAADAHLQEPAVDHQVGGNVPQVRVAATDTLTVAQCGVQHLVGHHEPPLAQRHADERIDVDLA